MHACIHGMNKKKTKFRPSRNEYRAIIIMEKLEGGSLKDAIKKQNLGIKRMKEYSK